MQLYKPGPGNDPSKKALNLAKKELREKHGLGGGGVIALVLLTICHWGGAVGLAISLVFVSAEQEWFSASILGNRLQIPVVGGVFILLSLAGIIGTMTVFSGTYWLAPIGKDIQGTAPVLLHIIGRLAHFWAQPVIWGTMLLIVLSIVVWNFGA